MKKVSIITINLNNKDGLRKTAESVVSQTAFSGIEWIVIDGGSSDGSLEVINEFCDKIAYCVSEPDKGIYNAMNKGVKQAHGEYVLFLNSGDKLHQNDVIEEFLTHELYGLYDFLVGRVVTVLNGITTGIITPQAQITCKDILSVDFYFCHQAEFIRLSRFTGLKYDESYRIVADMKFAAEDMISRGATYSALPITVADYDLTGISATHTELVRQERLRIPNEVLPPIFQSDYHALLYGDSLLTKIAIKIRNNILAYNLLSIIAGMIFFPIWLFRVLKVTLKRII